MASATQQHVSCAPPELAFSNGPGDRSTSQGRPPLLRRRWKETLPPSGWPSLAGAHPRNSVPDAVGSFSDLSPHPSDSRQEPMPSRAGWGRPLRAIGGVVSRSVSGYAQAAIHHTKTRRPRWPTLSFSTARRAPEPDTDVRLSGSLTAARDARASHTWGCRLCPDGLQPCHREG